jgi:hypothetical protein
VVAPRVRILLAFALALGAAAIPGAAPASAKTVWLCKPGLRHNPCETSLRTTVFNPAGQKRGVKHTRRDRRPKFDCFYVYPTVSDQKSDFANLDKDPEVLSIALYQAARYSQHCRVFAPMYRQRTIVGITKPSSLNSGPSYADVRNAWRQYLHRYNHGRGVVIMGHSQGTFILRRLVAREVDRKRSVRRRLISAILLGGNVLVKKGRDRGGDFKHIRACRSRRQTGCVIAFSTYNQPPPANSLFGRTAEKGMRVLCTNPAALGGGSGRLDPIYPTKPYAPGSSIALGIALLGNTIPAVSTPWVEAPGAYSAHCSSAGGANVLQVAARGSAPVLRPSPDATWGLHLTDSNIGLGNLIGIVKSEAAAYARKK